jgi:hypothetical protein
MTSLEGGFTHDEKAIERFGKSFLKLKSLSLESQAAYVVGYILSYLALSILICPKTKFLLKFSPQN